MSLKIDQELKESPEWRLATSAAQALFARLMKHAPEAETFGLDEDRIRQLSVIAAPCVHRAMQKRGLQKLQAVMAAVTLQEVFDTPAIVLAVKFEDDGEARFGFEIVFAKNGAIVHMAL